MTSFILIFTFEIIIFQLISHDFIKLNILLNYTEYPKGLVLIVIHTIPFDNSKISISNGSASPFGKDDFS